MFSPAVQEFFSLDISPKVVISDWVYEKPTFDTWNTDVDNSDRINDWMLAMQGAPIRASPSETCKDHGSPTVRWQDIYPSPAMADSHTQLLDHEDACNSGSSVDIEDTSVPMLDDASDCTSASDDDVLSPFFHTCDPSHPPPASHTIPGDWGYPSHTVPSISSAARGGRLIPSESMYNLASHPGPVRSKRSRPSIVGTMDIGFGRPRAKAPSLIQECNDDAARRRSTRTRRSALGSTSPVMASHTTFPPARPKRTSPTRPKSLKRNSVADLREAFSTTATEKPYACERCRSRFGRWHDLNRHNHQSKCANKPRAFHCVVPECGKHFMRLDILVRHMGVQHPEYQ